MAKTFKVVIEIVDVTGKVVGAATMHKTYATKGNATKLATKLEQQFENIIATVVEE